MATNQKYLKLCKPATYDVIIKPDVDITFNSGEVWFDKNNICWYVMFGDDYNVTTSYSDWGSFQKYGINDCEDCVSNKSKVVPRYPFFYELSLTNNADNCLNNCPPPKKERTSQPNDCPPPVITILRMTAECVITQPSSSFKKDGKICLNIFGGTPPYTVTWSNSNQKGPCLSNIGPGTYTATIVDSFGDETTTQTCTIEDPLDYEICFVYLKPGPTPTPTPTPTPSCPCPNGYTLLPNNQGCQKVTTVSPTVVSSLNPGDGIPSSFYGSSGVRIYKNNDYNISGNSISGTYDYQKSSSFWNNRMNQALIWANNNPCWPGTNTGTQTSPACQPSGLNVAPYPGTLKLCDTIELTNSKTYYIGVAGDNSIVIKINGIPILEQSLLGPPTSNFEYWHIYPVNLNAGINLIEVSNINVGEIGGFAAEIYDNTLTQLRDATSITQLNRVFSTQDYRNGGSKFGDGFCSNFSCPAGYSYDPDTNLCVLIQKIPCGGLPPTPTPTPTPPPDCIFCPDNSYCTKGLVYKIPTNSTKLLTPQQLSNITPETEISVQKIDIPQRSFDTGFPGFPNLIEWFQVEFVGYLKVPVTGQYTFSLLSDDGSKFSINNQLVIDNDGIHGPLSIDGTITLTQGVYPFKLSYFQGPRWFISLVLSWSYPGQNKTVIPSSAFVCGPD